MAGCEERSDIQFSGAYVIAVGQRDVGSAHAIGFDLVCRHRNPEALHVQVVVGDVVDVGMGDQQVRDRQVVGFGRGDQWLRRPARVDQHARASGGVPDQIGVGQPAGVHRALDDQDLAARLAALAARLPAWYSASASAESTSPERGVRRYHLGVALGVDAELLH